MVKKRLVEIGAAVGGIFTAFGQISTVFWRFSAIGTD
jgi:hypothetical protein